MEEGKKKTHWVLSPPGSVSKSLGDDIFNFK